jgi:hypothetical protein
MKGPCSIKFNQHNISLTHIINIKYDKIFDHDNHDGEIQSPVCDNIKNDSDNTISESMGWLTFVVVTQKTWQVSVYLGL